MFFANYILKDRLAKLQILVKNFNVNIENLGPEKSKGYANLYDIKLAFHELRIATESNSGYNSYIDTKLENIKAADNGLDLKNIFLDVLDTFKKTNLEQDVYLYYAYRDYNKNKTFQKDFIRSILSKINTSAINRKINIFDMECKSGDLLEIAKEINPNALCYGLENNNGNAERAKKHAEKIIKGEIKGSRIQNESFDILIANCNIAPKLEGNMSYGTVIKKEKLFIQNIYKYISTDGVAIIGLPFYRMHKDICTLIAKQYKNVTIVKGYGDINDHLHMVYIIGQKSDNKTIDEDIYNKLRVSYDYKNIPSIFDVNIDKFEIYSKHTPIEMFKGSVLDMEELYNIVNNDGAIDSFFERQAVDKIGENAKNPLLPFSVGQIGLVLTSGCLDGIVDEGDGNYHLVKGRVSKKSDIESETTNGVMEEKEIISNKVEINIILPNGDFKTLA